MLKFLITLLISVLILAALVLSYLMASLGDNLGALLILIVPVYGAFILYRESWDVYNIKSRKRNCINY